MIRISRVESRVVRVGVGVKSRNKESLESRVGVKLDSRVVRVGVKSR